MLYAIGLSSSLSETQLVLISVLTTIPPTRVGGIVVKTLIRRNICEQVCFRGRQANAIVVWKHFSGQSPFRRQRLSLKLLKASGFHSIRKFRTISSHHFLQKRRFEETPSWWQSQQRRNEKAKRQTRSQRHKPQSNPRIQVVDRQDMGFQLRRKERR